jgi:3-hydroxybutyryl-CoA dehydrogenase/5-formyl-3-hydroxy-2-methylpyridine 4-carboxylate dehydrogenase
LSLRAAVIGLGTMGPGIAATLARSGAAVKTFDTDPKRRAGAHREFEVATTVLERLGVPDRSGGVPITIAETLAECVAGAGLVVETVPEDLALKIEVLREVEALVDPQCILASDTSGIPISRIQEGLAVRSRVIGMHWSNPPHLIPMIEVIAGRWTALDVVNAMVETVRRTGHLPIVIKKDVPGFVENRVLYAVMRECLELVESGVIAPEELDQCVSWGIGLKLAVIGPMALLDMAGLDIYAAVAGYLNRELCDRADVASYITERTSQGKLGMKTGSGIFSYTPERISALRAQRGTKLAAVRQALES